MGATLDLLREMFPGKAMLTADDVAKVLGRDSNRAGREAVTAGLRRGDLLPGLRKVMGRWLVPITALADWMDGLAEPAEVSAPPVGPARRSVVSKPQHAIDAPRRGRLPNKVWDALHVGCSIERHDGRQRASLHVVAVFACKTSLPTAAPLSQRC